IAPAFKDRAGGYTRIMRLQKRASDSSEMAILEWVNYIPVAPKKKKAKDEKTATAGTKESSKAKSKEEGKSKGKESTAKAAK
ncbi:MAG: L17 family ribosomal protein, partial [Lentisphaerota bacterium]